MIVPSPNITSRTGKSRVRAVYVLPDRTELHNPTFNPPESSDVEHSILPTTTTTITPTIVNSHLAAPQYQHRAQSLCPIRLPPAVAKMAATEIAFAKSFLALLDTKPTKITPDHVEDPRGYPSSSPVRLPSPPPPFPPPSHTTNPPQYTLPRLPTQRPPPRRPRNPNNPSPSTTTTSPAPGSTPSLPLHIRSLRNPPLDLTLSSLPLATTSALDVKLAVAAETGIPVEKIKLLLNKKPVPDTRSLREMVASSPGEGKGGLELGVMVMGGWSGVIGKVGGGAAVEKGAAGGGGGGTAAVAQGLSGREVLETEAFWGGLKGFLEQRIRDEAVAGDVAERFRRAWGRG